MASQADEQRLLDPEGAAATARSVVNPAGASSSAMRIVVVVLVGLVVAGAVAALAARNLVGGRPQRQPVIIDTDVDLDDQLAIAYLLAEPTIEVKAITVLADGWSHQWSGVVNVMRLTKFFGQPDIPVAYSPKYNSDTQLNLKQPNGLPPSKLLGGIDNFLTEYVPLDFNERPPSWMYAPLLMRETLRQSAYPVDIIELGPLTTLAQALQEEPELFRSKVRTLYMSGGQVWPRSKAPIDKVWPYSAGNASEGNTSFTGKPKHTSWNVFSDPVAANSVFSFGLDVVIATDSYHTDLPFSLSDTSFIPQSCSEKPRTFLNNSVALLPTAAGENATLIKYWDQGTAVLAVQMIDNQSAVCTEMDQKRFAVMMEGGDNATYGGGRYARLLENPFGQLGRRCLKGNETEFKVAFFEGICGGFE